MPFARDDFDSNLVSIEGEEVVMVGCLRGSTGSGHLLEWSPISKSRQWEQGVVVLLMALCWRLGGPGTG